jgi:hypothetical protein
MLSEEWLCGSTHGEEIVQQKELFLSTTHSIRTMVLAVIYEFERDSGGAGQKMKLVVGASMGVCSILVKASSRIIARANPVEKQGSRYVAS